MAVAKIVIQTTILVGADDEAAAVAGVKKHLPEMRQLLSYGMEDLGAALVDCFDITETTMLTGAALDEAIAERDRDEDHFDEYRNDLEVA